jgi:hypothetical protein
MWDLTIIPSHDFYINTSVGDVLVHNQCGDSSEGESGFGPFHRIKSRSQSPETARAIEESGELRGQAARYSIIPFVKAFVGQLPEGARGIEFFTDVEPSGVMSGKPGDQVTWYRGTPGVEDIDDEWVRISCRVTLNTQC